MVTCVLSLSGYEKSKLVKSTTQLNNVPKSWFDAPRGIMFPEPPAFTVRGLKHVKNIRSNYQCL